MYSEMQFLIYKSAEEDVSVNAIIKDESVWLTQKSMAELFDCSPDNISLHLKNIFWMENWMKVQLSRKSR